MSGAARAAAKSASTTAKKGAVVVQTYRGYGSARHVFLMGRVFREPSGPAPSGDDVWSNIRIIWRLMRRWGVERASLSARFGDVESTVITDRDGYFRMELELLSPPPLDRLWHQVDIHLAHPATIDAKGDVFIPPPTCQFVVISDIDDTVMHTGVANKVMMMWRLFVQGADSRTAFPGMASFLRALHQGSGRQEHNPMVYVSRAPWAIYGVLERFFNLHDIPVGPILFLREWGLTLQNPLPRRDKHHKRDLILQMIAHYGNLPVILIGDSGQRDPEVYAEIARRFPTRVLAVYIRNVSPDPTRDHVIKDVAKDLTDAGCPFVLAADTKAMAEDAVNRDLITRASLDDIETDIAATD